MSIVMSHVSQWVNKDPTKVLDRDNNKPSLRVDLIPALRAKYGDKADKKSRVLKQRILNNVRKNASEFTSITLDHYLHEYPGADGDAYGARFGHKVWRDVLSLVTSFAGPTLQHKYIAGLQSFCSGCSHSIFTMCLRQAHKGFWGTQGVDYIDALFLD